MYVLYEDSGNFKAEKIFSQSDSTMQVESESGKRSKIKNASVLFNFEQPAPAALLEQGQELAQTMEIDFLWEFAPTEKFEAKTVRASDRTRGCQTVYVTVGAVA